MSGKLYLCATPIGNLKDITLRVIDTLNSVDIIACEDTRHTLKLLNHYEIKAKLTSYHEHNKYDKAEELVALLKEGKDIALVTDAGTPGISDPGEELVKKCIEADIPVTSLPGACAFVTAVSMSGLSSRRFVFEGFLPSEKKELQKVLESLKDETRTIIIYEAPHRLLKTLKELFKALGERNIRICRELTKIHEEVMDLKLSEAVYKFTTSDAKGEIVILIEGMDSQELKGRIEDKWKKMDINEHMEVYLSQGISEKEAMKLVAKDRGASKRDIYDMIKK